MKFFLLALPLCVLGVFSCERHDFEETKQLHEKHGAHDDKAPGEASHGGSTDQEKAEHQGH